MVTVRINGKPHECKTGWDEMTVGDTVRIFTEWKDELMKPEPADRDYFKLFCIINNFKYIDFVRTYELQEAITALVLWATTIPDFDPVPDRFSILGNAVKIPKSFGSLSIGQNIVMKQLLDKATYKEELIADAIAVAVQPMVDGSYNSEEVARYKQEILKRPISECYSLGFFFVARAKRAGYEQSRKWPRILNNLYLKPVKTFLLWLTYDVWQGSSISRGSVVMRNGSDWTRTMFSTDVSSTLLSSSP